ncbi:hypothetical protein C8R46DRAFT_889507 [Mycena filopes]|nr:hypothetical protein C8R46DRAFT_889507 [Mycena filopes]
MSELELSAVGDFTIERLGGIIDLTLSKSHPDHRLPRHIAWLLPHLLGTHRVPLYFFYGRDFPLKEPIPGALTSIGFVPTDDEVAYLHTLSGQVAFSQWVPAKPRWKRLRDRAPSSSAPSAPSSSIPSPHPPPIYESIVPASFPAVERYSGQKAGEDIHAFMERRRLHNAQLALHESPDAKKRRLVQEAHAAKGAPPGKKGARVWIWEEEEGGFFIRRAFNRTDAADRWDEFTPAQRVYDSFGNQWDLCTALAPNEDAEPYTSHDGDYDDDDGDFHFYPPTSPTDLIPSIPDVPGRAAMERETGQLAVAVLQRAYDLDPEDRGEDVDVLPGWQQQDHMLTGDLTDVANLCDLTSSTSDLKLDWVVDVRILTQGSKTFYEIRPRGADTFGPSILLESAATVLQIMRSGWASDSDIGPIIRNLAKLGAEFYPSWPRPAHDVSPSPSQPTLGRRPAGYEPTLVDYGVYVQRRNAFLRSPRGHAALFYGGIVGRLARFVLSDFTDAACLTPSDDVIKTGASMSTGHGALWREALTEDEVGIICGVYTVETGTLLLASR